MRHFAYQVTNIHLTERIIYFHPLEILHDGSVHHRRFICTSNSIKAKIMTNTPTH